MTEAHDGRPLAKRGFRVAAWKMAPRDRFLGWSVAAEDQNLLLIVNHSRFLILSGVILLF